MCYVLLSVSYRFPQPPGKSSYPHFTGDRHETQRGYATWPGHRARTISKEQALSTKPLCLFSPKHHTPETERGTKGGRPKSTQGSSCCSSYQPQPALLSSTLQKEPEHPCLTHRTLRKTAQALPVLLPWSGCEQISDSIHSLTTHPAFPRVGLQTRPSDFG